HPDVFACALLNSQPMGFYSPRQLIADAQRHDVRFLPLDVQASEWDYTMTSNPSHAVRVGFCSVWGVREEYVRALVSDRNENGCFEGLSDLVRRTKIPKSALLRIAAAGAFASFGFSAREALWIIQGLSFDDKSLFFGSHAGLDDVRQIEEAREIPTESEWQTVHREYATKGFSVDLHPLSILRPDLSTAKQR
ncbi:MAG: error-prone DNA polymerase, partial [Bdellovibrionota bacterium]